ncbi:MAG: hypothetical protein KDN22_11755 [Verrucomicrobiae bacterium]|nr:hypothetical protein [Verrucomicrobiae bacterium]
MNALIISLTGEITETNFDEWKTDLLKQIEGIQKELKSDGDFVLATDQAKNLKQAEAALKKAKESAIEQAADIQRLFAAIDEVSAAARNARLFLEGQVKARKQEIKDEIVQSGIRKVRALVEAQSDDFHLTDTRSYTDRGLFEDAIKGKRGIDGMDAAVGLLIDRLQEEISNKATAVEARARKLSAIAPEHQPLFQDRAALLDQSDTDFEATITTRIQVFEQKQAELAAAPAPVLEPTPHQAKDDSDDLFSTSGVQEAAPQARGKFQITLLLRATEAEAEALTSEIRENYGSSKIIQSIKLDKAYS